MQLGASDKQICKIYENSVGQPVEFVNINAKRLDFLRNFALERDIPMIVFGD